MLDILIVVGTALVIVFGFVVMFGAPYLPTLNREVEDALDLLDLQPGQTLLELGSGDGKVLLAAAKRGIHSVGYELNPLLVLWTKIRCWRYRSLVRVYAKNFWTAEWPHYDGAYVFLLQKYMKKLDKKIIQSLDSDGAASGNQSAQGSGHRSVKVVVFAHKLTDRTPRKTIRGLSLYRISHSDDIL